MGDPNRFNVVLFNNEGTGFGEDKLVTPGTKVGSFVGDNVDRNFSNYTITINGERVSESAELTAGDKIVIMPKKHGGARR